MSKNENDKWHKSIHQKEQNILKKCNDSDSDSDSDSDYDSSANEKEYEKQRENNLDCIIDNFQQKAIKKLSQKEYNKQYYATNKKKILSTLLTKKECPHCGKSVNHQNMKSHQRSSRCKKTYTETEQVLKELRELREIVKNNQYK
jgi:ribosomal protein S27AE